MTSTRKGPPKDIHPLRGIGVPHERITPLLNGDPIIAQVYQLYSEYSGTLGDICEEAGVSTNTPRGWFLGRRSPSLINLTAVLQVLGYRLRIERIPEE